MVAAQWIRIVISIIVVIITLFKEYLHLICQFRSDLG